MRKYEGQCIYTYSPRVPKKDNIVYFIKENNIEIEAELL